MNRFFFEARPMNPIPAVNYAEYILSPEWRIVCRVALAVAHDQCQLCHSADRLNVHHKSYRNLGHETLDDVIVLCEICHERHHKIIGNIHTLNLSVPIFGDERARKIKAAELRQDYPELFRLLGANLVESGVS
jgi:hypothetical protein